MLDLNPNSVSLTSAYLMQKTLWFSKAALLLFSKMETAIYLNSGYIIQLL